MKIFKSALKIIGLFYALLCIGMYFYQDKLLFHPAPVDITNCPNAKELGVEYVEKEINGDKIRYLVRNVNSHKNLIMFHGNASTVCGKFDFIKNLEGVNLYFHEYPGFSSNDDELSQESIYRNTRKFMKDLLDSKKGEIFYLYGESLGTGVATYIAANFKEVTKLFLQSPYTSIVDIAKGKYPFLPIEFIITNKFKQVSNANKLKIEVFSFYAELDKVIPKQISLNQHENFKGPKQIFEFKGKGHSFRYENKRLWDIMRSNM